MKDFATAKVFAVICLLIYEEVIVVYYQLEINEGGCVNEQKNISGYR
jgi:hypothetical protein